VGVDVHVHDYYVVVTPAGLILLAGVVLVILVACGVFATRPRR
jgi:hypothetical protein